MPKVISKNHMLYEVPEKRSYENMYMLLIEYAKPQKRFFPSLWQTGSRKDKELFFFFFFFWTALLKSLPKSVSLPSLRTLYAANRIHTIYTVYL